MATYAELYDLYFNDQLQRRLLAAVAVACDVIRTEDVATPKHTERVQWAREAIRNVDGIARQFMWALLAQYSDQPVATIEGATDAQIQTAVNNTIGLMI